MIRQCTVAGAGLTRENISWVQTISLPYTVDDAGNEILVNLPRVQSAATRTAYANVPGMTEK